MIDFDVISYSRFLEELNITLSAASGKPRASSWLFLLYVWPIQPHLNTIELREREEVEKHKFNNHRTECDWANLLEKADQCLVIAVQTLLFGKEMLRNFVALIVICLLGHR